MLLSNVCIYLLPRRYDMLQESTVVIIPTTLKTPKVDGKTNLPAAAKWSLQLRKNQWSGFFSSDQSHFLFSCNDNNNNPF